MITLTELHDLIGPMPSGCPLEATVLERIEFDNYIREKVRYQVEPGDWVNAYVFIPGKGEAAKSPAIFCHHQHQGEYYSFGKKEPAGLAGNPDLAYARELAEQGFLTIAPDAIAYGERSHPDDPIGYNYWLMATKLVQGKTLLAKNIHDVKRGIDYLTARPDVDPARIGFIGHSYGGRMAIWGAAFDKRIKATVCNCGCISYKESLGPEAGIQMPFIIQGIMEKCDIEDIVQLIEPNHVFLSATTEDKWCKGIERIYATAKDAFKEGELLLKIYPGGHKFTAEMRANAYDFLRKYCGE